jgi:hypothetical protein
MKNYGTVKTANAQAPVVICLLDGSQYHPFLRIARTIFIATTFLLTLAEPSSIYNPTFSLYPETLQSSRDVLYDIARVHLVDSKLNNNADDITVDVYPIPIYSLS